MPQGAYVFIDFLEKDMGQKKQQLTSVYLILPINTFEGRKVVRHMRIEYQIDEMSQS